jgi:hypothetical protein
MNASSLKDRYISLLAYVVRPPAHVRSSLIFNLLGLQILRAGFHSALYAIKRSRFKLSQQGEPSPSALWQKFDEDGIVVIRDLFDSTTFDHVVQSYQRLMDSMQYRPFKSNGYVRTISISGLEEEPDKQQLYKAFTNHPLVNDIVSRSVCRKKFRLPRIVLQDIYFPEGAADIGDSETELHPDRLFHHPKLFFYVNDQDRHNGAYIFAPGSHRYQNSARLRYEYRISVKAALWSLRRRLKLTRDGERYKSVYELSAREASRLELKPHQFEAGANTAILSDNRGFHARGIIEPGYARRQVRIQYQYLILPLHARMLLWMTSLFRPRIVRFFN